MKKIILLFLPFITATMISATDCKIQSALVYSEELSNDYNAKGEFVQTYAQLSNFAQEYPKSVQIRGSFSGNCANAKVELMVYHQADKKWQTQPVYNHTYLDAFKDKSIFVLKNIPHARLYKSYSIKSWSDQTKYKLSFKSDHKVIATKEITLASPMHD